MSFVPSPIVLLGSLIAALAVFLSGFAIGVRWEKGKQAADVVAVQEQVIDNANISVESETKRSVAAGKKEAEARIHFDGIRRKGEIDALAKANTNCNRDSVSLGLLSDAIKSANGTEATTNKLSEPVHTDP